MRNGVLHSPLPFLLSFDPPVDQDAELTKLYESYYREWKALYEALKEPFMRLQALP